MVYFQSHLATSLQNFIHLSQSLAEILLFAQKFKIAAADIMVLVFVYYFFISACKTSVAVHMPKFVQICATVIEL